MDVVIASPRDRFAGRGTLEAVDRERLLSRFLRRLHVAEDACRLPSVMAAESRGSRRRLI